MIQIVRTVVAVATLAAAALGAGPVGAHELGALDRSFSRDGIRTIDFGRDDRAMAVFVDPHGLTVGGVSAAGYPYQIAAAKVSDDGSSIRSFGAQGRLEVNPGRHATGVAAWTRTDTGALLVLGGRETERTANDGYYLARLTPAGNIDASFGGDGFVHGRLGEGFNALWDVLSLPAGRILVLGDNSGDAVVRAHSKYGKVDSSFGTRGAARIQSLESAAFIYHPSGRILVVGALPGNRIAVYALTADGGIDRSFGRDGRSTIGISGGEFLAVGQGSVAIDADGRIVVGALLEQDFRSDVIVARLRADGSRDRSFGGGDGWQTVDLGKVDSPAAIVPLQDGKLLVTGRVGEDLFGDDVSSDLFIAGLRNDGAPWKRFGKRGFVRTDFGRPDDSVSAVDAAIIDGRLVVVGRARGNMLIARFFV